MQLGRCKFDGIYSRSLVPIRLNCFVQHGAPCFQSKASDNSENRYNHNFDGLYCTCERPYPDPDSTANDVMLQCIICEDWYHSKVRGRKLTGYNCTQLHPFLQTNKCC